MEVFFSMKIVSGNDAFSENPKEEVIKILQQTITDLKNTDEDFISKIIRDIDGYEIGTVYFEIDEDL